MKLQAECMHAVLKCIIQPVVVELTDFTGNGKAKSKTVFVGTFFLKTGEELSAVECSCTASITNQNTLILLREDFDYTILSVMTYGVADKVGKQNIDQR